MKQSAKSLAIDVTVIIATYNRWRSLRKTLATLCQLQILEHVRWELLVMDNNSTDQTPQVCAEFRNRLPLRHIYEPRQGKSHALNRAVEEARGALLLLTDDDVDVDPHWMVRLWQAAQDHPDALFFGGRVIPRWERAPPAWLEQNSSTLLAALTLNWDLGSQQRRFDGIGDAPAGANVGYRAAVFQHGARFRLDLGPMATATQNGDHSEAESHFDSTARRATAVWTNSEDAEFLERLQRTGALGIYVPTAVIYHRNSAERMTEKYLRNYYQRIGRTEVRLGEIPMRHLWFGVPRYVWWKLVASSLTYALTRWTAPAQTWIRAEQSLAACWGVIQESRRLFRQPHA